jgi:hypothetical protein
MDILQAARQLYPGTAWVCITDKEGKRTLTQAIDGTPRVPIPDLDKLDAIVAAYVLPVASPSLQDQLTALQMQVKTLLAAQGKQ